MEVKTEKSGYMQNIRHSLVWARMRYSPYWPARMVQTPPEMGKTPRDKHCVLFFGTKEFGFVDVDKIENYESHRERFVAKGKGPDFQHAVKEMDEFLSNPELYKHHGSVKFSKKKKVIKIKTERNVELGLKIEPKTLANTTNTTEQMNAAAVEKTVIKIKTERNVELGLKIEPNTLANTTNTTQQMNAAAVSWNTEKQSLVDKIVALKAECHKSVLDLKKSQADCVALSEQNLKQEEKFSADNAKCLLQINELRSELEKVKTTNGQVINDLNREKQLLLARIKQYQAGVDQKNSADKENKDDSSSAKDVYEVELILKHKDTRFGRKYLIRWKGYDSKDDSWEHENNLNCPKIMKQYVRSVQAKEKQ